MGFENISSRASEEVKPEERELLPQEASLEGPKKIKTAVNRFVNIDEQTQKIAEQNLLRFSRTAKLAEFEKDISPDMKSAIEQINELLVNFLQEWGLEEYVEIDARNIVLGDIERDEKLRKEKERYGGGAYYGHESRILMLTEWKIGNYRKFVKILVHEMIHMQAYQSWQRNPKNGMEQKRRQGMQIIHTGTPKSFAWLDEAITEELTKRFMQSHEKSISILGGIRKPAVMYEKLNGAIQKGGGGNYSYKKQREELSSLITSIHIHGRKKYKNRDQVLKLFTNAALNGRLLPVARAIEKAKGRGMFKKLAGLDINLQEKE